MLLVPGLAHAQQPVDFCRLVQKRVPAKTVLTTFVVIGAFPHGFSATSVNCPKTWSDFSLALGDNPRSQAFESWLFYTPSKLSGIREVQVTADFTDRRLRVTRVHAYRELSDEEASLFRPKLSPQEEKELRKAAYEAAKAADEAARP